MAERNVEFAAGVTLPVAETALITLYGGTDQDVSLASLPSAPAVGAHSVRIRVTVMVTGATGGITTVRVRQGQGTGGAIVGQPAISAAALPAGSAIVCEVVDTAPSVAANQNGLNYTVTASGTTSAGTGNVIAEIEEVN